MGMSSAFGATTVTTCGTDTAAGGLNLATALVTGGDIQIQCAGGPNEIRFTAAHTIAAATRIDGGSVALIGTGSGVMFVLPGVQVLSLSNLSLRNPPLNPADPNSFTGVVYDKNDVASVELANVQVSDTRLPFAVRRLVARDSTFSGNGDANNSDFGVVMAGDLELNKVVFRDNLSRPIHALWRGDPIAGKQKIAARLIECTFERNKRPILWAAGELSVHGSTFTDNGDAVPYKVGGKGNLYGGQIFLELGNSMAGAVEVVLGRAIISRSTFKGNHGMLGGAVLAWNSALTLQSSDLDDNRAVSGGAVAYLSPLGASPLDPRPWLRLGHVKLHRNHADKDGGAFLVLGNASGDAVMISGNQAGESGGAIAIVGVGILPTEAVPATIAGKLPVSGTQRSTVELTRTFVLDNTAAQDAVAATQGIVRFGNTIIARNEATAAGGAAVHGADIELANSTVMGNKSDGVSIEAFGTHGALLANTIVAGNTKNCVGPVVSLTTVGANLQSPGNICGASVTTAEPSLDSRFRPSLASPARSAGTLTTCASHDLVRGVDVYGNPRDAESCSIGAVEADLVDDAVRAVGVDRVPCLLMLFLIFLLVCLLVGFIIGVRRRRKKKAAHI
jgi:hypothetical protein